MIAFSKFLTINFILAISIAVGYVTFERNPSCVPKSDGKRTAECYAQTVYRAIFWPAGIFFALYQLVEKTGVYEERLTPTDWDDAIPVKPNDPKPAIQPKSMPDYVPPLTTHEERLKPTDWDNAMSVKPNDPKPAIQPKSMPDYVPPLTTQQQYRQALQAKIDILERMLTWNLSSEQKRDLESKITASKAELAGLK